GGGGRGAGVGRFPPAVTGRLVILIPSRPRRVGNDRNKEGLAPGGAGSTRAGAGRARLGPGARLWRGRLRGGPGRLRGSGRLQGPLPQAVHLVSGGPAAHQVQARL